MISDWDCYYKTSNQKMISSYVGENAEFERQMLSG